MMALPQIVSRNQIQRIATIALNVRKVLSGGTDGDFYTCPTGKKALIKGFALCTGTGAAATVGLNAAGVQLAEWRATGGVKNQNQPRNMELLVQFDFEVQLDAGDIIQYDQNTGTNAEMNMNAEILETPV